jgi:hypothetical protein
MLLVTWVREFCGLQAWRARIDLLCSLALRRMPFHFCRSPLQVVLEPLIDWNFHRLAEFDELHNIESSLTTLDLGHEGLSVPKTLG